MKICVVGNCGHSGQMIREGAKVQEAEFVGYCPSYLEEDLNNIEQIFEANSYYPARYDNYKSMLKKETPDVLVVDSMFCDHCSITSYALECGINVFCEKPVALSLKDCERLEKVEQKSTATFWAMQTLRYEPWTYTAKKLIDQGAVGQIRMINCQKSYKLGKRLAFFSDRNKCGGLITWVAIHGIDAIQYLCPQHFRSVFARHSNAENSGNGDLETTSICLFELDNNVLAHVNADYYRPASAITHGDDRIRVVGTEGVLEVIKNKVFLINMQNNDEQPQELVPQDQIPTIFGDFLQTLQGYSIGLLNASQSILITKLALLARDSADSEKLLYL
jgi:predicted dehydrogenase